MSEPIRIIVADDHPVVREGLVTMLETQEDFIVVGEAATGNEVIEQARATKPNLLLLDLEMPDLDGVEALKMIRKEYPGIHAIVFTAFDTDERILGAVQAGAQGYLLKGAPRREIFRAIRIVSEGGSLLEPVIASKLMQHLSRTESNEGPVAEQLTEREMEVLRLLARGRANREIAEHLVISERTVKFHVSSILGKLGATNRTEAVTIAAQHGLVNLS